jgi:hypothetical protein
MRVKNYFKKISFALLFVLMGVGNDLWAQPMVIYDPGGGIANTIPFSSTASNRRALIYTPADFTNAQAGLITRVYFMASGTVSPSFGNVELYMGPTTASTFTSAAWPTGLVQVLDANNITPVTFPRAGGTGTWFAFDLQTPYLFDNATNFIIDAHVTGPNPGVSILQITETGKSVFGSTANPAPNNTQDRLAIFGFDWVPAGPCVSPPFVGNAVANPSVLCVNGTTNLSVDSMTFGQGQSYQWQSSLDGTNWTNMANDTLPSATAIVSDTTYFRLTATCGGVTTNGQPIRVDAVGGALAAGTYTINSALPTGGPNFQSFTDFIDAIECGGVDGPVVLNVVPGSGPYTERLVMDNIPTDANKSIYIQGNGETIQFNNINTSERAVIELRNTNHITFDSLVVKTLNTANGWGFWLVETSDSNVIKNCDIDITSVTGTASAAGIGINMTATATSATTAGDNGNYNLFEGNRIIGATASGAYTGINIIGSGTTGSVGNIARHNIIQDFRLWGIRATNASNTVIDGNLITRPNRNNTGIVRAVYLTGSSHDVVVSNNIIHSLNSGIPTSTSTTYGISNNAGAVQGSPTQVFNNLMYNFDGGGIHYGIYNAAAWTNYYHNTVVLDDQDSRTQAAYAFYTTTASNDNLEVFNNLFYMDRNTSGLQYAIRVNTATVQNFNSNNNAFYIGSNASSNGGVGFRTSGYSTLADWTNATTDDANSVVGNPDFINPGMGDFTPSSAALAAIGQNLLSVVPTDLFGNPRISQPSPGAIEFLPPPCPRPGISLVGSTDTSATLFFMSLQPNGTYNIEWGPVGFTRGTGNILTITGDTLVLDSLARNGCYDIYVQLDCTASGDSVSLWTEAFTFCTDCSPFEAPYFQGFEFWSVGPLPGALERCYDHTTTNASYHWEVWDGVSPTPNTTGPDGGANSSLQYLFVRASGTANSEAIFSIPEINTNTLNFPELRFFYHMFGTQFNEFRCEVFNDSTNTWDVLFVENQPTKSAQSDPYLEVIANLTPYKSDNTRIQFVAIRGAGTSGQIAIDDISIDEAPACPDPLNLDTLGITASTVELVWDQAGVVNSWEIEWGPVGFVQGTAGGNIVPAGTNPFTVTGLPPGGCYDFYVRALCGAQGTSQNWTGPIEACTPFNHDIAIETMLSPVEPIGCGDSLMPVKVVLFNNGTNAESNIPMTAQITGDFNQTLNYTYPGPLAPDLHDTVTLGTLNTFAGGMISIDISHSLATDENPVNDQLVFNNITLAPGHPDAVDVTYCPGTDSVFVAVTPFPGLSYNWFETDTSTASVGSGDSLQVPATSRTWYVSHAAGSSGSGSDSLEFTLAAGNSQNGNMFDISVLNAVELQGFTVSPNSAGSGEFEIWHKTGSYVGFENGPAGWTLLEAIDIGPLPAAGLYRINLTTPFPLSVGAHAFYVTRVSGSVNYTNGTTVGTLLNSNDDLQLFEGIGKSHPFGSTFAPRVFNGLIHYGNPGGACESARIPVLVTPYADTAVADFTFTQTGPGDFSFDASASNGDTYSWDFGDGNTATGQQVTHSYVTGSTFAVTLVVTEAHCGSSDTIVINVTSTVSLETFVMHQNLKVFPNPTNGQFSVSYSGPFERDTYFRILAPSGQLVEAFHVTHDALTVSGFEVQKTFDLSGLSKGIYILQVETGFGVISRRIVVL